MMRDTLEGTDVKLKVSGVKFPCPQNAFVFLMAGAERIGTRDALGIIAGVDNLRKIGVEPQFQP
jgi:deoxyribose-phosphate aldolase